MDSKYLIGVPEMDEQHSKIFDLIERTKVIFSDEFEMNIVIMELIGYANTHLDNEEAFLKQNGLADFEREHSKKHTAFRMKAMECYDTFRGADTLEEKAELLKRIGSFCEDWLFQHIHVEDRTYAELLKKHRAS